MALTDHIGILLQGSFDRPQKNRLKPEAPPEYYAVVAFDPSAGGDLASAMAEISPGGNWKDLQHAVKPNSALPKPFPGIANDALVVRFGTQFAVEVRGEDGVEIMPTVENSSLIRSKLFSGQRVRINGAPYLWNFKGKNGISWNLYGAMAVGGGERRPGGAGAGSFDKYIPEGAQKENAFAAKAEQPAETKPASNTGASDNPFQQTGNGATTTAAANPFA